MKNYEKLKPELFKRLIDVKPDTFEEMLREYKKYYEKKSKGGKPNKLKRCYLNIIDA